VARVRDRLGGVLRWQLGQYGVLLAASRTIADPAVGMRLFTMQHLRGRQDLRCRWEPAPYALGPPGRGRAGAEGPGS
jgi:hypothetical protein